MIYDKINKDIYEEFEKLRKSINESLSSENYDIDLKKDFLSQTLPKEVMQKANILLDTLLNYLMDEAIDLLKNADIEIRNAFFRANINEKIEQWARETITRLMQESAHIDFGNDVRLRNGLIAGGVTFVVGATVTAIVFMPYSTIAAIVAGIVSLIASVVAYKVVFDKSSATARENLKQSVMDYIQKTENLTTEWLKGVINAFSDDFRGFCKNNNINFEGEIK